MAFTNAKFFPKNDKTKDYITDITIDGKNNLTTCYSKRSEEKLTSFVEPINVYQVANVLRTLIGERPIPSFRDVFYKFDDEILDIANNSFINISSPITEIVKNKVIEKKFISECTRIDKAAWNAWSKPNDIQWFKIKKYMGNDFDIFIELLTNSLGYNPLSKKFNTLQNIVCENIKIEDVLNFLVLKKKMPIYNYLTKKDVDISEITKNTALGETVNSGVDSAYFLDGEILVPFTESFANKIIKDNTNILDGGFVEIIGVFYEYELTDIENFIQVSSISTEKI